MSNKRLKIGFIGGGINSAVGNTHKIASQMDSKWELVSGCFSTNPEINKQTAQDWHVRRVYESWEDMLIKEQGKIDAIAILTPSDYHFEILKKAIEYKYSIISEKTITSTFEETQTLYELSKKNNTFLTVINNYTGYNMLRELKSKIEKNELGKIHNIQIEMPQQGFITYNKYGKEPRPQDWRLNDGQIPTIYLDLGIHLYHIVDFLIKQKPVEINAIQSSNGFFKNIIDDVSCLVRYHEEINAQFWFSKSALGYQNGLRIRVFGNTASAEWLQTNPEVLYMHNNTGQTTILQSSSKEIEVANNEMYNRFKPGHPAGFIEAFANYYSDIADNLIEFKNGEKFNDNYLVSAKQATEGMLFLKKAHNSAINKGSVTI